MLGSPEMTRSKEKRRRAELLADRDRAAREARWNPPLPPDELRRFRETTEALFTEYERHSRPAAGARVARETGTRSTAGGPVLWPLGEAWPTSTTGKPLTPVLELFVDELPVVPDALVGTRVLQVFLELEPPRPPPADGYFTQRSYEHRGAHRVVTRSEPTGEPRFEGIPGERPTRLEWSRVSTYPTGEDAHALIPRELRRAFDELPSASALLGDRVGSGLFPHVGGWPHWLDDGGFVGDFVMQLDGELLGLNLGTDGQLYFGVHRGEWEMLWAVG